MDLLTRNLYSIMWFHFSFVGVSSNYELLVLLVTNWILTQSPQPYILTLGFFHFGQKFWIAYKYMEQDSIDDVDLKLELEWIAWLMQHALNLKMLRYTVTCSVNFPIWFTIAWESGISIASFLAQIFTCPKQHLFTEIG